MRDELPPTIYIGSTLIDACLPGFRKDNDLGFAAHGIDPPPAIWIGNRTIASCHYDAPNNIACCVVGRRRFTLFPPEQIFNLYPGPLDPTPGGQAISLVDFAKSGLREIPAFPRRARQRASRRSRTRRRRLHPEHVVAPRRRAERVQHARELLVEHVPEYIPTPMNALYHAMWSFARSARKREACLERSLRLLRVLGAGSGRSTHPAAGARRPRADRRRPGALHPRHADKQIKSLKPQRGRSIGCRLANGVSSGNS